MPPNDPKPIGKIHRRLRDDEINLWLQVAATIQRRPGILLPVASQPPVPAPSTRAKHPPKFQPAPPRLATAAPYIPSRDSARPTPDLAPLERRLKRKLLRGQTGIDETIDLHGLRQQEAHHALRNFIIGAHRRGARLLLIVTGKGTGGQSVMAEIWAHEPGVLRRSVPHWLRASDLMPFILSIEEAGAPHGGAGALYVRLRRHP